MNTILGIGPITADTLDSLEGRNIQFHKRAIADVLAHIRAYPPGVDVELEMADKLILDPLFASCWPNEGYYAGHRVTFRSAANA